MTIKTYHYHSIFWWGWQGLASGRFTFGHAIESSIVTCNLRNITFQFVIVITFNGNVFSMHYGVPIASVVYDRNQVLVSGTETETKIKFRYLYPSLNFFYLNRNFLHFLFLKFFSCFLCLVLNISHVIQSYHVKLYFGLIKKSQSDKSWTWLSWLL